MKYPLLLLSIWIWVQLSGFVESQGTQVVNVGAIFAFNSVIGRVAKVAIKAAQDDIDTDQSILKGIKLNFIMEDANCSVFMGSVGVFKVLEKDVVAIIGPQSSSVAHTISFIANGLQVPLISFAATDPTLSALQFPFFLRTTLSDSYQMAAMANLVDYYDWHEVITIYVDDDYGRNGIAYLENELANIMAKISYKIPLLSGNNHTLLADLLNKSKSIGPRVYIVHVNPDSGPEIFSIAHQLQMMTSEYVWLVTDWLSVSLDSSVNQLLLNSLQGVIGLRQHIPESYRKNTFLSHWKELRQKGQVSFGLNNYGLYAYDTVWAVARGVDEYLKEHQNITFSSNEKLHKMKASALQLEKLKTFDGGNLLLQKLRQISFTGLSGPVQFDPDRNLIGGAYEVYNIDRKVRGIGFWSNDTALSTKPPETFKEDQKSASRIHQKLMTATWPGGKTDKPRGWVIATNERPLRIGVPNRVSFVKFATKDPKSHNITGYCIDVFNAAQKLVPYDIPYKMEAFGDGQSNPSFEELVRMVSEDVFDAAVGDITIVTSRTRIADFTQPYASDGLVIVIPVKDNKSSAWTFLKPFTVEMWCVTAAFFVIIGVVIWILEHRINDDFRGPPRRQMITMFLFSFSTLFKTNQEDTISTLGRMVMMVWLFLLMVITSSYTASLTSILTIQQLSSPITGIDSLIASNQRIGVQKGSFAWNYLTDNLNIHHSRLITLGTEEEYERALRQGPNEGGVAAVVDEYPYMDLFLSKRPEFGMVGQMFTKSGWGFAFKRGSPLAVDMSSAILKLQENGDLEKIHKNWFCKFGCKNQRSHQSDPNQLHLFSFWGLFLLCGIVTVTCLLVFFLKTVRQFVRYKRQERDMLHPPSSETSNVRCSQVIFNFFNFIDEKEEAIKKMFNKCEYPPRQQA